MIRAVPFLIVVLLWPWANGAGTAGGSAAAAEALERGQVVIVTAAGARYRFKVEIARTGRQRAEGLQGRKNLAPDAGMLFDFGESQRVAMWMKDTFLALDMIFIDDGGRIVDIARHTVPQSLEIVESALPVKGVLEVRAGTTARLGIRAGDRVLHPIFE